MFFLRLILASWKRQPTLSTALLSFFSGVFGIFAYRKLDFLCSSWIAATVLPEKGTHRSCSEYFLRPKLSVIQLKTSLGGKRRCSVRHGTKFAHKIFISKVVPRQKFINIPLFFWSTSCSTQYMMVLIERMPSTAPQPIHQLVERK